MIPAIATLLSRFARSDGGVFVTAPCTGLVVEVPARAGAAGTFDGSVVARIQSSETGQIEAAVTPTDALDAWRADDAAAGLVTAAFVEVGDYVREGEALLWIGSSEAAGASWAWLRHGARLVERVARRDARVDRTRHRALRGRAVGSGLVLAPRGTTTTDDGDTTQDTWIPWLADVPSLGTKAPRRLER